MMPGADVALISVARGAVLPWSWIILRRFLLGWGQQIDGVDLAGVDDIDRSDSNGFDRDNQPILLFEAMRLLDGEAFGEGRNRRGDRLMSGPGGDVQRPAPQQRHATDRQPDLIHEVIVAK